MIAEEIPKVSHSTHVSKYFLVTYTSLMLSIVENVIAFILADNASVEAAKSRKNGSAPAAAPDEEAPAKPTRKKKAAAAR